MRRKAIAVKMCGLTRREDAEHAAQIGAAYAGVVLAPGGKRTISTVAAREILKGLPVRKVGVFVDADPSEMAAAAREIGLHVLQLHGDESPETVRALRDLGPWEIWKAFRIRSGDDVVAAVAPYGTVVDGLLLDGWSNDARGGTGSAFPWDMVSTQRGALPTGMRLVVAGGLTPANVASAVHLLSPELVDVSSGVEVSPGIKDPSLMSAFMTAAGLNQPS